MAEDTGVDITGASLSADICPIAAGGVTREAIQAEEKTVKGGRGTGPSLCQQQLVAFYSGSLIL